MIEGYGPCGSSLVKAGKRYEVCEKCANKVKDILKRSAHAEN